MIQGTTTSQSYDERGLDEPMMGILLLEEDLNTNGMVSLSHKRRYKEQSSLNHAIYFAIPRKEVEVVYL